jgi:hypothetical protein
MIRGLILGSLAFAAVFAAERQYDAMGNDVQRYDALRAMSGDPPFYRQLLASLGEMVADFAGRRAGDAGDLFTSLTSDVVRYATMRNM